ncbi:hypothetical protein, variant [Capsaspora owczarzaki ATCC 30864]|nr:hypothetical protein, variant [Capsaspora owczarzaki ATCC 30864]
MGHLDRAAFSAHVETCTGKQPKPTRLPAAARAEPATPTKPAAEDDAPPSDATREVFGSPAKAVQNTYGSAKGRTPVSSAALAFDALVQSPGAGGSSAKPLEHVAAAVSVVDAAGAAENEDAEDESDRLQIILGNLGAKITPRVIVGQTTHLVFRSGQKGWLRQATENAIPVVTPEWVYACESGNLVADTDQYRAPDAAHLAGTKTAVSNATMPPTSNAASAPGQPSDESTPPSDESTPPSAPSSSKTAAAALTSLRVVTVLDALDDAPQSIAQVRGQEEQVEKVGDQENNDPAESSKLATPPKRGRGRGKAAPTNAVAEQPSPVPINSTSDGANEEVAPQPAFGDDTPSKSPRGRKPKGSVTFADAPVVADKTSVPSTASPMQVDDVQQTPTTGVKPPIKVVESPAAAEASTSGSSPRTAQRARKQTQMQTTPDSGDSKKAVAARARAASAAESQADEVPAEPASSISPVGVSARGTPRRKAASKSSIVESDEVEHVSPSKRTQPQLSPANVRRPRLEHSIALTSLDQEIRDTIEAGIAHLGVYELTDDVRFDTTHVVVGEARRTLAVYKGLVAGCWIVSPDWVLQSIEAGSWISEEPFEMERAFEFAPVYRLEQSTTHDEEGEPEPRLFQGLRAFISIECNPPRKELAAIVSLGGGEVVDKLEDASACIGPTSARIPSKCVHLKEAWLLDSVLNHKILPQSPAEFREKVATEMFL